MKYWEIIADNLSKGGWTWGCVSAIDSNERTIWIADAHRHDGQRLIVHADDKLTAFLELELQRLAKSATPAILCNEKNYFSRSGMCLAGHSHDGLQSKHA